MDINVEVRFCDLMEKSGISEPRRNEKILNNDHECSFSNFLIALRCTAQIE